MLASKSARSPPSFKSPLAVRVWHFSASSGWVLDRRILSSSLATATAEDEAALASQVIMAPDSPRVQHATLKYSSGRNPFLPAPLARRPPPPPGTSTNRAVHADGDSDVTYDDDDEEDDDDVWDRSRSSQTARQQWRRGSGVLGGGPRMKSLLKQDVSYTSSALNNANGLAIPHHSSPVVLQAAAAAAQRRQSPRSARSSASRPRILTFDSASRNRVDPAFASEDTVAQTLGFPSGEPALMAAVVQMEKHAASLAANIRRYGLRALRGHRWQSVVKFQVVSVVMVRSATKFLSLRRKRLCS